MDTTSPGTAPLGIAVREVGRWLAEQLPRLRPPFRYERMTGGHSNVTYAVCDAAGARVVLRRPPVGHLQATAHDVLREHRVLSALAGSGVPVPRMLGACRDPEVTGAPFYVMDHVPGLVVDTAADAEELLPDPDTRRHAGESLVDALVALHAVDVDAVGLGDLARRSGYLDRQLARWSTQWSAAGLDDLDADMGTLHGWLVAHRPAEAGVRLVHGDFRLGNTIVGPDGTVRAVLDWELCTLGEPLLDLAYLVRAWTEPDTRPGLARPLGAVAGFPSGDALIARYAERSGTEPGTLGYWRAFTAWRSAAILGGVHRRHLDRQLGDPPEHLDTFRTEVASRIRQGLAATRSA